MGFIKSKLINNVLTYVVGDVLVKAIPFFLIPIVTRFLTVDEYGKVSYILTVIEIMTIIIIFGGHNFYRYKYFSDYNNRLIYIPLAVSFIVSLVIFIASIILYCVHIKIVDGWLVCLLPITAFFQSIAALAICHYQMKEMPTKVTSINLALALISATTTIIMFHMQFGYEGRLFSLIFTPIFVGVCILFFLHKNFESFSFNFIKKNIHGCLAFGIRSMPASISWWLRAGMDRVIIINIAGSQSLGIYSLTNQLTLIVSVFSIALNNSIMPLIFRSINSGIGSLKKLISISILFVLSIAIIYYISLPLLFKYFIPRTYMESLYIIGPLLGSVILHAVFLFISNIYVALNKPGVLSIISMCSALLHCIVSIFLTYSYGISGTIWSGMVSYTVAISVQMVWLVKVMGFNFISGQPICVANGRS